MKLLFCVTSKYTDYHVTELCYILYSFKNISFIFAAQIDVVCVGRELANVFFDL